MNTRDTDPRVEDRARQLAERHKATRGSGVSTRGPGLDRLSTDLLKRLPVIERVLREAYTGFASDAFGSAVPEERGTLSGVAEWVLDNYYVIQKAIRQIGENMPRGYYRRLPKLVGTDDRSPLSGYPRVYAVAREIIRIAEGQVDVDRVRRFIRAYQEVRPLTMGEIWALPTMLRLSLVELLAWTVGGAAGLEIPINEEPFPGPVELENKGDEAIVAGVINSLRAIDDHEWDDFFEATSLVEETLRLDPADVYPEMDFDSRDRYRGVVEKLARETDQSEQEVARAALRLARRRAARPRAARPRAEHVGFYLVGRGRAQLEEAVGFRPGLLEQARRWVFGHPTPVYLGSIAVITGLVLAGVLLYAHGAAGGGQPAVGLGALAAVALLTLLPASIVGVNLTNMVITRAVPPRVLPKLDFSDGIPADYRTMVVIPALLSSDDEVDFLLRQLELHYQGNADPQLGFALLSDFADAPQKQMPEDEHLLQRAREGIRRLNRTYGKGGRAEGAEGPFPPRETLESQGVVLDGVGAEARQAGRVQPPAARRA